MSRNEFHHVIDRGSIRIRWNLLIAVALLSAVFAIIAIPDRAHAQNASCGEPQRSIDVDMDRDGTVDRTVDFERCTIRTFTYDGTEKTVIVHYTVANGSANDRLVAVDSNGDGTTDISADDIARQIAQWTETAWRTYRDYGANDPMRRDDMNAYVYDMRPGLGGWCCGSDHYQINAPSVVPTFRAGGDTRNAESIVYHEMWHAAEWSGSFGCWVNEATASNMTDHVNLPIDNDSGNDYIGRVGGYMGGGNQTSLLDHCYNAAPWWQYFMEQTGSITSEPDRGVDAMLDFWRDGGTTDFTRMDNVTRANRPGRTLESLWIDFAVANYAKELTGPSVPALYRYQDEIQAGAPDYPAVALTSDEALNNGASIGPVLTDIAAWSSHYYQFRPAADVPLISLEVRQDSNRRLGYVLLLTRGGDLIQEIRHVGRDFVQSFANNNYDNVVLIVVGLNEYANFRYAVNATAPVLNIRDPLTARKALAGDPAAPDKMLVQVEVLAPGGAGTPIAGIDPTAFSITVGSRIVMPADRVSAAYVQGQYWLLMRAPTQTVSGDYTVRVDYTSLTDSELSAVRYQDRNDFDNVLVIDHSGSMDDFTPTPMQAAKDAGRLYVDSWRDGDQIGVVSFDDTPTTNLTLRPWDTGRGEALDAISLIEPDGGTSIGSGLHEGLDELIDRGNSSHDWALIVLSDGKENTDPKIPDFLSRYNTRSDAGDQVPRIHAVALGPDADRARLEDLASRTGGNFYFASIPAAGEVNAASVEAARLTNGLAQIYRSAGVEVARQDEVYAETTIFPIKEPVSHTFAIDGAASEAVAVLKWDRNFLGYRYRLFQPDGTEYPNNPTLTDNLHLVWRIPTPQPGQWTLLFDFFPGPDLAAAQQSPDGVEPAAVIPPAVEALVEVSVKSDLNMEVFLGLPVEERLVGKPMPILTSLADSTAILGADVRATISKPNGSLSFLKLYDDGNHGDGAAGDGFYGATFYQTQAFGSYGVTVRAAGTSTAGTPFDRYLNVSFNMLETRVLDNPDIDPNRPVNPQDPDDPNRPVVDEDGDGILDWWEDEYGLDPDRNTDDKNTDPDFDGVPTGEEFEKGTNPVSSDTDGQGQNDGSEITSGGDPLDPSDDQIPCPLFFHATNVLQDRSEEAVNARASVLTYDVAPDHSYFFIWRAESPEGPPQVLEGQAPATGVYSDTAVTLGVTYFYWLAAYDAEGHASCILGPVSTTPSDDPVAPVGMVAINGGERETTSLDVTLMLEASPDTTEMQVRNDPLFDESTGWEAYATEKTWTLQPDGDIGRVFVLYRDGAGNVSDAAFDAIEIVEAPEPKEEDLYLPSVQR